jgi:hypothetical protein
MDGAAGGVAADAERSNQTDVKRYVQHRRRCSVLQV